MKHFSYYEKLMERYGSPLYTYDYEILTSQCQKMRNFGVWLEDAWQKKVSMHYSTKANSNPTIMRIIKQAGLQVDCMSPMEMAIDLKCGFAPDEMLYVCNNISLEEMKKVHDARLLICLDSISQVDTWGKEFPGTDIMIRINPGTVGVGHSEKVITSGKETKFGISEENLNDLFAVAKNHNLNIIGVHQHLGSLFLNDKIPNYIAGVKTGLEIVKKHFNDVKIIDLGGGFGVPYLPEEKPLDLEDLSKVLVPVLNCFIKEYPSVKELKFEPGRYIPCEAGNILGSVTAIKYENGKYWIGTNIGMNQVVRPSMYGSYHEISILSKDIDNKQTILANFVGNICESGDILGKDRYVSLPEIGDIVIVQNAGAYGYSMASNYTGRMRPAEVLLKEKEAFLIREAETEEDQLSKLDFSIDFEIWIN